MTDNRKQEMHVTVVPMTHAGYLLGRLADEGTVFRSWDCPAVARGLSPLSWREARAALREYRAVGIYTAGPVVVESALDADEMRDRVAALRDDDDYLDWLYAMCPTDSDGDVLAIAGDDRQRMRPDELARFERFCDAFEARFVRDVDAKSC